MELPDLGQRVTVLPAVLQRTCALVLTAAARLSFRRRQASLPPLGDSEYLTAIIRLGASAVPDIQAPGHYVYPAHTVHVTVANLDTATVDVNVALANLADRALMAPTFRLDGLGCSPDTAFLRSVHDRAFGELRDGIRDAFGVHVDFSPQQWLVDRLSFANVVRFDGRGEWLSIATTPSMVVGLDVEIVRTDRYLSDEATVVLGRIPLRTTRRLA